MSCYVRGNFQSIELVEERLDKLGHSVRWSDLHPVSRLCLEHGWSQSSQASHLGTNHRVEMRSLGASRPNRVEFGDMDKIDILREICTKLSDDTLRKIVRALRLWTEACTLLQDNTFWKARTESVARRALQPRPDACWSTIYYGVVRMMRELWHRSSEFGVLHCAYDSGMNDLSVLEVLLEIAPADPVRVKYISLDSLSVIKNADVLRYLRENGYLVYNDSIALQHFYRLGCEGSVELMRVLVPSLSSSDLISNSCVETLLMRAVMNGIAATVELLLSIREFDRMLLEVLLEKAREYKLGNVMRVILAKYPYLDIGMEDDDGDMPELEPEL